MLQDRECSICQEPFVTARTMGRPVEICSAACRQESARRRSARWRARLFEARQQVQAMQANAA
jgi:hypothetical protein